MLKGSAWVTLSTIVTRFAGFIVLPFLARLLSPEDLGLYNLMNTTVQTGDRLSRLGADAAIHRNGAQFETIGPESVGRLFGVGAILMTFMSVLIALCLLIWREPIALRWLGEERAESWLGLVAIVIVIYAISNPPWLYLIALHEFRISSLRSSTVAILGAIITLFLAWRFKLSGAIWGLGALSLLHATLGWGLVLPILQRKQIKLRFNHFFQEICSILSFGLPFFAGNFLSSFIALPLLGYVSRAGGIEQIGYLRVAQSLSQLISFLPTAIAPVLISTLSANISANTIEYRQTKSIHLRSLWIIILTIATYISFSLDYLIPLLFGDNYSQAIFLSRLTIWITAMTSLSGMMNQYVISSGRTKVIAIIQTTALGINLLLGLLLIPKYNSVGLLIAQGGTALFTTVAYIKPAILDLILEKKRQMGLLVFLSLVLISITFILSIFSSNLIIFLVLLISASAVLFLILLISFDPAEKAMFILAIKKYLF